VSSAASQTVTIRDFDTDERPTWCPGCGDFGILNGIKRALAELGIAPHEVLFTSGIGCGSKLPHYLWANEFNSLHGRALPVAMGAKLANHALTVISVTGDGDGYGIGGNHLVHLARRNLDVTHVVQNNHVYALTKGQYSPTSEQGWITTTSPEGVIEYPINPLALALAAGAGFVARAFSGDPRHMAEVVKDAIQYRGYALVDVLQDCVVYNRVNTTQWYRERVYKLSEDPDYDPTDRGQANERAHEYGDRIPIGVFYRGPERPTYESQAPALQEGPPLVRRALDAHGPADYRRMLDELA
jgi:2-oxoglutarate ferredoxin oxidoreductase subunit beta